MSETNRWYTPAESPEALAEELEHMNDKLDRLMSAVGMLDRRRSDTEEMLADLLPAANGAMSVATRQLWEMERRGTLSLIRETVAALQDASGRIDHDDLRALGSNAGQAVRTLRKLTGPEVSTATDRTVQALQEARTGKPPGFFSLLFKLRKPRVRRGLGAALRILEALGEGAHPVPVGATAGTPPTTGRGVSGRTGAPSGVTAPAGPRSPAPSPSRATPAGRTSASSPATGPSTLTADGTTVELDADGFLADPQAWTPAVADALAAQAGIGPLTDEHWTVLEFCRSDAGSTGAAPGLRRITKELDIPPKDMYRLFPKGPGTLAARLAGLGKPKSCV